MKKGLKPHNGVFPITIIIKHRLLFEVYAITQSKAKEVNCRVAGEMHNIMLFEVVEIASVVLLKYKISRLLLFNIL